MLHEVDDSLQNLLANRLKELGSPIRDVRQVTLGTPGDALRLRDGEAYVNLYLYDVRENAQLRDEGFTKPRRADNGGEAGFRSSAVRLDMAYLITVHAGDDPRLEHQLLGDVFGVLFGSPVLSSADMPENGALHALAANMVTLQVAFPGDITRADLSALWQAMDGPLRPAVHLVVTAPFYPRPTRWMKTVRESPRVSLTPTSPATVSGIVLDAETDTPLAGAVITLPRGSEASEVSVPPETGTDGIFLLEFLPAGAQVLTFARVGYDKVRISVTVPPAERAGASVEPVVVAMRRTPDKPA